jgi:hypothetical protein
MPDQATKAETELLAQLDRINRLGRKVRAGKAEPADLVAELNELPKTMVAWRDAKTAAEKQARKR